MKPVNPEAAMAAALGGRGFGVGNVDLPVKPSFALPSLRPGDVHVGGLDTGGELSLELRKLIEGRLLIQGASGAGKSWTLRRLLEQTAGQVQQILIDPEGEFRDLGEKLGMLHLEGHRLDIATLALAAARCREHRVSILLDLSELDREDQMKTVAAFFPALIQAPREHWHPVLVAVDEAHLFAPFGGHTEATAVRKAAIQALTDLMSRGRKRGLAGVLATQRIARMAKSVVSEVHNFMVGLNTLDLDIRRAAETIGWDARKAFDRLPLLAPGEFVVVGPAFSRSPAMAKVGSIETQHRGATPQIEAPTSIAPPAAAQLLDLDGLLQVSAADAATRSEAAAAPGARAIRGFIRDASFPLAGRVWGELQGLAPDGALLTDLTKHLKVSPSEINGAIALLDLYGTVDFSGEGKKRAVRIGHGMTP